MLGSAVFSEENFSQACCTAISRGRTKNSRDVCHAVIGQQIAHLTAPRRGEAANRPIGAASRFHARTRRRCWACGSAAGFMRYLGLNSNSTAVAPCPPASSSSSAGPGILCVPDVQLARARVHAHGPCFPVLEGGLANAACKSRPRWSDGFHRLGPQTNLSQRATPGRILAPLSSTTSQ